MGLRNYVFSEDSLPPCRKSKGGEDFLALSFLLRICLVTHQAWLKKQKGAQGPLVKIYSTLMMVSAELTKIGRYSSSGKLKNLPTELGI